MHLRVGLLCLLCTVLCGCNNFLAKTMVAPPNGGRSPELVAKQPLKAGELRIPVGPPDALVSAWILEPTTPPRATILLLHGFIANHHQLERTAKALQAAGYRAVLIDLRGHGRSTGEYLTFGVNDARDMAQITTYLQEHHLCGDSVGVYGASYGAATALLFAGSDPRVKAVFAVAPFASLREEAPYFGKHLMPIPGLFMSADDYRAIVNQMGTIAHFDPDASSPLDAIRKTTAHVRLIHGADDWINPAQGSRELAAAAPDRTELTIVPGKGHLDLCLDWSGAVRAHVAEWFDKNLVKDVAGR